jgi:hypothetical protein
MSIEKRLEIIEQQNKAIVSKLDLLLNQKTTGLGGKIERVSTHSKSRSKKNTLKELDEELRNQFFKK